MSEPAAPVPFVDLAAARAPLRAELQRTFARVIDHARFVLGPEVAAFEEQLARFTGAAHAVGVSSGTDALLATFLSLDYPPGSEVVTTPFTFISTASSVLRAGLRPVFADLAPGAFHPDAEALEAALTERTRAVLVVHLYGEPIDLRESAALCEQRSLDLIEDCAQAIGARFPDGRHVGRFGRAGTLSFFPAKNLGALGDGGAVLTDDPDLATTLRAVRQHGCTVRYRYDRLGGNFRLDALQAAMLGVLLPHLPAWTEERRAGAAAYRELLAPAVERGLLLPPDRPGHVWNQFVVRSARRDKLRDALAAARVGHAVYYPHPLHTQPVFTGDGPAPNLPEAERRCTEVLALPIAPGLSPTAIPRVAEVVNAALME